MGGVKEFATRTRVEGLVIFLVAAGYLWEAHNVPEFYQIPGVPGPTTFPRLLGIVFALCGLWLLVSPMEWAAYRRGGATPGAPAPAAGTWVSRLMGEWHFYTMWVVILGYLWFMPELGFPVATWVLLAVFIGLLGERRWHVLLGLSLASTVLIYAAFKMGLNVRLPLGVLEALFK
jgi:hypothetical protein